MRGTIFSIFTGFCQKFSTANAQIVWQMDFSQKFQMQNICFCRSDSIPCCLVDPGMFSLVF